MVTMTHWLLPDVVEGVGVGVDNLALDLVCPTTVVSEAASAESNVSLGHGEGLAVVQALYSGQCVEVLLEEIGELGQELASILWGLLPPWALEGFAGSGHCNVDILLGGLVDRGDDLLVGGVDDLEGLAVYSLDELVVDEARGGN